MHLEVEAFLNKTGLRQRAGERKKTPTSESAQVSRVVTSGRAAHVRGDQLTVKSQSTHSQVTVNSQ